MKTASKELEHFFFEGIKKDREMKKHSRRVLNMLAANKGDVKRTIVQAVMAAKVQTGLVWAAQNEALHRSLEAMVIKFADDFVDVPNIALVASWRMQLVKR
jgi:16S rRNA G1207 methylase RsmC